MNATKPKRRKKAAIAYSPWLKPTRPYGAETRWLRDEQGYDWALLSCLRRWYDTGAVRRLRFLFSRDPFKGGHRIGCGNWGVSWRFTKGDRSPITFPYPLRRWCQEHTRPGGTGYLAVEVQG